MCTSRNVNTLEGCFRVLPENPEKLRLSSCPENRHREKDNEVL